MRTRMTRWITVDDSLAARRLRSRLGGALFVIAGMLAFVAVVAQPGWRGTDHATVFVLAGAVLVGGAVQALSASRISAVAGYPILTVAIAGTAYTQVVADPATTGGQAVGLMYVWIVMSAALYCTIAATAVQVSLAGLAHGVALAVAHTAVWLPQWIMTFGTCLVMAGVVNVLSHELNRRAHTDALTGVASRRALMLRLPQDIRAAERRRIPLSVLLLDLDHFKQLNDTRGHAAGDDALRACVAAWRGELRPGDTLARLGGDEFFAVLPGCDVDAARVIAERLVRSVRGAVGAVGRESGAVAPLSCSVGMTTFRPGDSADALLHRTDRAMYEVKAAGGDGVILAAA